MGYHNNNRVLVRQVWAHNLQEEFLLIRKAISRFRFPVLSLDTEFPGTVFSASSCTHRSSPPDEKYAIMKLNVDALKMIQLGLTVSDVEGNLPTVWQFNFKDFNVQNDLSNPDSIALLKRQGVDFEKNREKGICSLEFARLFLLSGLVSNGSGSTSVSWVTFHGAHDFAYLIKILSQRKLPDNLASFLRLMMHYFGVKVYDLKHMAMTVTDFRGGLEKLGQSMGVGRVAGNCHEAGSDSLFTLQTYVKFRDAHLTRMENRGGGFNGFECLLFGLCREGLVRINYVAPRPRPQPQLLFVRRPNVIHPYLVPFMMMAPVM